MILLPPTPLPNFVRLREDWRVNSAWERVRFLSINTDRDKPLVQKRWLKRDFNRVTQQKKAHRDEARVDEVGLAVITLRAWLSYKGLDAYEWDWKPEKATSPTIGSVSEDNVEWLKNTLFALAKAGLKHTLFPSENEEGLNALFPLENVECIGGALKPWKADPL